MALSATGHQPAPRGTWFHLSHNSRLVATSFILAFCFFTFGYDGSVMSGILAMPTFVAQFGSRGPNGTRILTATDTSVITAVPISGALLGLPLAAYFGDRIGRKKTLLVACVISTIGAVLQTAAVHMATFTVGRWLANVAIFIFIVMASTFMAEVAPPEIRGAFIGLSIVLIDAAAVLSAGINWAIHGNTSSLSYRLPLGIQIVLPMIVAVGLLFIRDSPTFYLIKSKDSAALASLQKVRKGYSESEVDVEFAELKAQSGLRQEENQLPWNTLFKGSNLRRTLLAMSIGNFQQLSGIAFATNYATIFLDQIGGSTDPYLLVFGLSLLAIGGAVVGLFLVDSIGRRALALGTFVIILIIDVVVGALGFFNTATNSAVPKAIAAFCLVFAFFFAAGFGPLTYVVVSEIPTARLRNKTSALSFLVLACFSTAVVYVLPYIANPDAANLGAKTYLIFAGWMLGCTIITYFCLPETKGRSPAELDIMFEAGLPARKFKDYVCDLPIDSVASEKEPIPKYTEVTT